MSEEKPVLPDEMSQILQNLKSWQLENRKPTLNEITESVESELDDLRKLLIEKLVNESDKEEMILCPNCDNQMMRNGKRSRKLKEIGDKEIELKREQMRCHQCGTTFFPPR